MAAGVPTASWCSFKEVQRSRRVCGGAVVVYFLVLAFALPRRFPEPSFSLVCLATLVFFCCGQG